MIVDSLSENTWFDKKKTYFCVNTLNEYYSQLKNLVVIKLLLFTVEGASKKREEIFMLMTLCLVETPGTLSAIYSFVIMQTLDIDDQLFYVNNIIKTPDPYYFKA